MSGMSLIAAFPLAIVALRAQSHRLLFGSVLVCELFIFLSTGPINAVIVNSVSPRVRAAAMAVCIFVIHLLGDALSSPLIGTVSDALGLARAMLLVPAALIVGGVIWLVAARTVRPMTA
jgi:hypothetical protein